MNANLGSLPVLVAGGGIGGLAAALALTRRDFAVKVLEQAAERGWIGAGIQLGPTLSTREMARIFHARGVERLVRSELWKGRTPQRIHDALEWLYGCTVGDSATGWPRAGGDEPMDAELGRLEDLPADDVDALRALNRVPLWPSLRAVLSPGQPQPKTRATHWPYQSLRPLLLQAGEVTPIERAERRVLVLANPGHGLEKMQASAAMCLGMQQLLPGEWAPSYRHTPNTVRMVVEGEGARTITDGEKCVMRRGDLILTPTGR